MLIDPEFSLRAVRRIFPTFAFALAIVLIVAFLPGCGFMKPDNLKMISPQELNNTMAQNDILLVDVHIPEQNHITGTDRYIPFYNIYKHKDYFPQNKTTPIYLYCKTGPMANWAARSLFDLGYTNVFNLEGGIEAWKESGLPVVK